MFPCQNNPSFSVVQTAINCMLLCFLQATFVLYSLVVFCGCTESDLMHYSPSLALATLVSLLFLGHSLWSECRYQSGAQALLNHMPKLAWFWQTAGKAVLWEMNKKIGYRYLGLVLSQAGFLRIFLCLALLEALIFVLGELLTKLLLSSPVKGGLNLPIEQFNMNVSWSCSPSLPQGTEPCHSAELSGSAAILGRCSSPSPRTSPGLALDLSQWATGQISQSCLLAPRDFAV